MMGDEKTARLRLPDAGKLGKCRLYRGGCIKAWGQFLETRKLDAAAHCGFVKDLLYISY